MRHNEYNDMMLSSHQLVAEIARLRAALEWLDRWMGHKPMTECADKIRQALDKRFGTDNPNNTFGDCK